MSALPDPEADPTPEKQSGVRIGLLQAAAFAGSLIAYLPVVGSWLSYIGQRYYQHLMQSVGLDAGLLDLPDRATLDKGIDLVLDATSVWVTVGVFFLPFILILGMALGLISAAVDRSRVKRSLTPIDQTWIGRVAGVFNRLWIPFIYTLATVYTAWLAVYRLPPLADDAAEARRTCVMVAGTKLSCPGVADYGDAANNAHVLVADKQSVYVYQDLSVRRIKLDDLPAVYLGHRPLKQNPPPHGSGMPPRSAHIR